MGVTRLTSGTGPYNPLDGTERVLCPKVQEIVWFQFSSQCLLPGGRFGLSMLLLISAYLLRGLSPLSLPLSLFHGLTTLKVDLIT